MNAAAPLTMTMRAVLTDVNLLGKLMAGASWTSWRVLLIAAMGEGLTPAERVVFKRLTGRDREPVERCEELLAIVGRRGGKSFAMAVLIVYLAAFVSYGHVLTVGERPVVLCLSPTAQQSRVVYGYCCAIIEVVPLLASLIRQKNAETLSLTNGVDIEIRAASFRGLRGVTAVAVVADEVCFWYDDSSANPDVEILNALRPSLATTNGLLACISSPYAKRGVAYEIWSQYYGPKGDAHILVAQGSSRDFNPSLPQRVVDRAMEKDPASARAEWLGEWRTDVESFVDREIVDGLVDRGIATRPRLPAVQYFGAVDPAGGSGQDFMTMAVAHRERDGMVVIDLVLEERPPFLPEQTVREWAATFKCYGVTRIVGDRWGTGFVREHGKPAASGTTSRS